MLTLNVWMSKGVLVWREVKTFPLIGVVVLRKDVSVCVCEVVTAS